MVKKAISIFHSAKKKLKKRFSTLERLFGPNSNGWAMPAQKCLFDIVCGAFSLLKKRFLL